MDTDTLFELFIDNFYDGSSELDAGVSWFMNGVYSFPKGQASGTGGKSEMKDENSGRFFPDYPYENVSSIIYYDNADHITNLRKLINSLHEGCGRTGQPIA